MIDWVRHHPWVTRVMSLIALVIMFVGVPIAAIADPENELLNLGQTPGGLAWIHVEDSSGISAWNHELSLDRGGVTSPIKGFWSSIVDLCWGGYRAACVLAVWFLDWVMTMDWLAPIAAPMLAVGDAMQSVVNSIGAVPTLLTITAVISVIWMFRGKWATGIWELAMACVIASLASGLLAQPVHLVAGPDGYITNSAQAGQQVASTLATGDSSGRTPAQLRADQTGQLVDIFVRYPTQIINYGAVLDGGPCEKAYNDVVQDGPYGMESDIRDAVKDCEDVYGDYAENPSGGMAVGTVVFLPSAGIILVLGILLGGSVIAAGITVLYLSVKSIITLILGLLPGGGRGSFLLTAAEAAMSLLILFVTSIFLSVFLLIISALFISSGSAAQTFLVIDILLLVGVVIYWRQRKNIKESAARLAQWMGQRPGTGATSMPQRQRGGGAGQAMGAVHAVSGLAQARHARAVSKLPAGPTYIDNRQQAMMFGGPGGQRDPGPIRMPDQDLRPKPAQRTALGPGRGPSSSAPPPPGGGSPSGSGQGLRRISARTSRAATGVLVRAGTHAAIGALTGGSSLAVSGGMAAAHTAKAVQTTRRAVVITRLASATAQTATNGGPNRAMPIRTQPSAPIANPPKSSGPRQKPASQEVLNGQVLSSNTRSLSTTQQPLAASPERRAAPHMPKPEPPAARSGRPGPQAPTHRSTSTSSTAPQSPVTPSSRPTAKTATPVANVTPPARDQAEVARLERLQARVAHRRRPPKAG